MGFFKSIKKFVKKATKVAISPYTALSSTLVQKSGLANTPLGPVLGTLADPLGLFAKKPSSPAQSQDMQTTTTTGIGTVGEGGAETFTDDEEKRKAIRKKKLGARALQIPLQSTDTSQSSGVSGSVSGTGGLQI